MALARFDHALNYGLYVQGFSATPDGSPHGWQPATGPDGFLMLDQRLGLADMAARARQWAADKGHVAFQLRKTHDGFRNSRAVGCVMQTVRS